MLNQQNGRSWTHFIGIGGAGMSGLAKILLEKGNKVSGSDLVSSSTTRNLADLGANIFQEHNPEQIVKEIDRVVISSAISPDNPEVQKAQSLGIPVLLRVELLEELMAKQKGIAIAGSHGKTTTSSMIAWCLESNGWDPTIVIGGEANNLGKNAKLGQGEYVVAEADESDGSFLKLNPYIGIITNIENDHLDYYHSFENIILAFDEFLNNVSGSGFSILCLDSPANQILIERHTNLITYGFSAGADYRAVNLELKSDYSKATIHYKGTYLGTMKLIIPGEHNVYNALAAVALCLELGLPFGKVVESLALFRGVKRRFQHLGTVRETMVIDDYAHHPTEIKAVLGAARQLQKENIWVVFQPHRFSRTQQLFKEFAEAFSGESKIILSDIYSAGEEPIEGITSELIVETINRGGDRAIYLPQQEAIIKYLVARVKPGDLVMTLGAGDIWQTGRRLLEELAKEA
ncbi:MAG: UDP-N-acetylmuramate--L-alanine ligase [Bacillota bacterium]